MKLRRHLLHRVGLAVFDVAIVAVAMLDRHAGFGVIAGLVFSGILFAIRDHRREQKLEALAAAKYAEIDRRLATALAEFRQVSERLRCDDVEDRWS